MNVRELIVELQKLPPETPCVYKGDGGFDYYDLLGVETPRLRFDKNGDVLGEPYEGGPGEVKLSAVF